MQHVREALDRFLDSETSKVLTIRGPWGVGKTYFWKGYITKRQKPPKGLNKYAYVSLFGCSTLAEVNSAIISKTESWAAGKLGEGPKLGIIDRLKRLAPFARVAEIPYIAGTQVLADYAIEQLIRNQLVCFDDLERKANLEARAFTGLISQLVEQKGYKVVLIYNDHEVKDETLTGAIAASRDKLIDQEIEYDPPVASNLSIAGSPLLKKHATDCLEKLGVANIRVMKRTADVLEYLDKNYGKRYPHFRNALLNKGALLAIIHYGFAHKFSLDVFAENDMSKSFRINKDDEVEQLLRDIRGMSSRIGYLYAEWEEPIHVYILNGFVAPKVAENFFQKAENLYARDDLNEQHTAVWRLYNHTFLATQEQFVAAQLDFLEKHCEQISLHDVDSSVSVIRQLIGESPRATVVLEKAIAAMVAQTSLKEFDDYGFRHHRLSKAVSDAVIAKITEKMPDTPLSDLLVELTSREGFSSSKLNQLKKFTKAEFLQWITTSELDTVGILRNFIERFGTYPDHGAPEAVKILREALDEIKARSKIDEMRVNMILTQGG